MNTIAVEGFLSEIYPFEYLSMEADSLIKENETIATEGAIGDRIKEVITKFTNWIRKLFTAIRDKVRTLIGRITSKKKELAAIDVIPSSLEPMLQATLKEAEIGSTEYQRDLNEVERFTNVCIEQLKSGSFNVDWGGFVQGAENYKGAANACHALSEKISGWVSSGDYENETSKPSNLMKQLADVLDKCEKASNAINEVTKKQEKLCNPSEIARIAQSTGLKDDENSKYVVDFTGVMVKVYSLLPAMTTYFMNLTSLINASVFAYNKWKTENKKGVSKAAKAAYKAGYRAENEE